MKRIDMTGQRYGRLIVISYDKEKSNITNKTFWKCICDCGSVVSVCRRSLITGNTKSCGCLHNELARKQCTKHGYSTPNKSQHILNIWRGMMARCYNKKNNMYKHYGGRGIAVCKDWHNLKAFGDWAVSNGCNDGLQIDRINNNGDYCPENCRFVTPKQNSNNRRVTTFVVIKGEKLSLMDAAEKYHVPYWRIRNRLNRGYSDLNLIREVVE